MTSADGAAEFASPAEAYDRYIGRYSGQLARELIRVSGIREQQRALDVGCGPGALTAELARVVGPHNVSALDASEPYVEACRQRTPGADVRLGIAEALPFGVGEFDFVFALLVLNLLDDAEAGVREMTRVARPGGVVVASVWADDGMPLLQSFWEAALAVAPEAVVAISETGRVGYREEQLWALWRQVGLGDVSVGGLEASTAYANFDDLWSPIEAGVGKSGELYRSLDSERRRALRSEMQARLGSPTGSFRLTARAWYVRGTAYGVA